MIAVGAIVFGMRVAFQQIMWELFEHPMTRRRRSPNSDRPDDPTRADASATPPLTPRDSGH